MNNETKELIKTTAESAYAIEIWRARIQGKRITKKIKQKALDVAISSVMGMVIGQIVDNTIKEEIKR